MKQLLEKKHIFNFFIFFLIFLLSSCATVKIKPFEKVMKIPDGKSLIYVYTNKETWSLRRVTFRVYEKSYVLRGQEKYQYFFVAPEDKLDGLGVNLRPKPGEIHYIRYTAPSSGGLKAEIIPADIGASEIANCATSGPYQSKFTPESQTNKGEFELDKSQSLIRIYRPSAMLGAAVNNTITFKGGKLDKTIFQLPVSHKYEFYVQPGELYSFEGKEPSLYWRKKAIVATEYYVPTINQYEMRAGQIYYFRYQPGRFKVVDPTIGYKEFSNIPSNNSAQNVKQWQQGILYEKIRSKKTVGLSWTSKKNILSGQVYNKIENRGAVLSYLVGQIIASVSLKKLKKPLESLSLQPLMNDAYLKNLTKSFKSADIPAKILDTKILLDEENLSSNSAISFQQVAKENVVDYILALDVISFGVTKTIKILFPFISSSNVPTAITHINIYLIDGQSGKIFGKWPFITVKPLKENWESEPKFKSTLEAVNISLKEAVAQLNKIIFTNSYGVRDIL